MNNRQTIDQFLNQKRFAMAGVSHNPRKFGRILFKTAREKGYDVVPVNPGGGVIDETICVKSVLDLDSDITGLLITTHKRDTKKVLEEAVQKGIKNIWIQNGCETQECIDFAGKSDVHLISKACFIMYSNPKGIHKFHQTLAKLFGSYVKEQQ